MVAQKCRKSLKKEKMTMIMQNNIWYTIYN